MIIVILDLIYLDVKKATATVPKGTCKTVHNATDTVRVYQVMDNKAVTFVDNYYDVTDPLELIRVERHTAVRNALNVPAGMTWYNAKMGAVDSVDSQKGNHYSLETVLKTAKWNLKFLLMVYGLYQVQAWNIYRHINRAHHDREEVTGLAAVF